MNELFRKEISQNGGASIFVFILWILIMLVFFVDVPTGCSYGPGFACNFIVPVASFLLVVTLPLYGAWLGVTKYRELQMHRGIAITGVALNLLGLLLLILAWLITK